jgi:hypothetical protein
MGRPEYLSAPRTFSNSGFPIRHVAARAHFDHRLGQHLEAIVRQIVFESGDVIAECIDIFAARAGLRIESHRSRMTDLIRQAAGSQMQ